MWQMQERVAEFDAERFQSLGPAYLALSLAGEAGELANVVKKLWRTDSKIGLPEGFDAIQPPELKRLGDELADVVILALVLANHLKIDVEGEVEQKLRVIDERLQGGYYGHEAKG